jgi:hypothetical protein
MADLDYAFVADSARIESGTLSVLGASYTHATVNETTGLWVTSIAGRVRTTVGADPVQMEIAITAPDDAYELVQTATLEPGGGARPYGNGKIGILFASSVALPIVGPGLFEIRIRLDGQEVRRLAFDLSVDA